MKLFHQAQELIMVILGVAALIEIALHEK